MKSSELIKLAEQIIPGGVNSPVRAFGGVGGSPIFFKRGQGAYIFSEDDQKYIDYVGSWGPLILGHSDPEVVSEVQKAVANSMSFGAPTVLEIKLAQKVTDLMPSIEKVRMVSSGTEATMSAIRLARGYTGKNKFIKFIGCYHGHSDNLLVKAGSGLLTFSKQKTDSGEICAASSAGVTPGAVQDTLLADFNNLDSVTRLFETYGNDIAAIILEPIPGNMNMILPSQEFLQGLRDLCDSYNSVLIFDEVMSGFRVALGGAQSVYNIKPDLTTLGKVIGGGMPVGAFGGRSEIMDCLSPIGNVYQAGTLSGNPVAMAAGLKTLEKISKPEFFNDLSSKTDLLVSGISEIMAKHKQPFFTNNLGGMFGLFFTKDNNQDKVNNFEQAASCNIELFKKFFHNMLNEGVYLAPSAFEAGFVSSAHTQADIEQTIQAADKVLSNIL